MALHVVGCTTQGRLYYTKRNTQPASWRQGGWVDVTDKVGDPNVLFSKVACATISSELHICGIEQGRTRLLHTRLDLDGEPLQGWGEINQAVPQGLPLNYLQIGLIGLNNELVVVVEGTNLVGSNFPPIRLAIRTSNPPAWSQQKWEGVIGYNNLAPSDLKFYDLAVTDVDGVLQLSVPGDNNHFWHVLARKSSPVPGAGIYDYELWRDLKTDFQLDPGAITSVAIAGIDKWLQVCAIANDNLWHTMGIPTGNYIAWDNPEGSKAAIWGDVTKVVGGVYSGVLTDVACARVAGNLHICCVTSAGELIHTIRQSNPPSWQNPEKSGDAVWKDVIDAVGPIPTTYGSFSQVAVAGDNDLAFPLYDPNARGVAILPTVGPGDIVSPNP